MPLNTMCSMKWATPLSALGSRREPQRFQMPTDTERTCGIGSVMITMPLGKTSREMVRGSFMSVETCVSCGATQTLWHSLQ